MLAMECSHAATFENCKLPPAQRKYISMFHIDGAPILPPLMTTERRRKMRKLKQKAIEVEQQLAENRQRKLQFADEAHAWKIQQITPEDKMPRKPASHGDDCYSARSNKSSTSQNSACDLHANESYLLLSNLIHSTEESKKYADSSTCTNNEMNAQERNIQERMQKLQKSETMIYDNCSNTIIMPISNLEQSAAEQKVQRKLEASMQNGGVANKCDYRLLRKPQIPSICVNPPTPLAGTRKFTDALITSEDETNTKNMQAASWASTDEFSTDESVNTSHMSSASSPRHKTSPNITSKILKFESLQNEQKNTSQTPRKSLETACTKPPQRSATSPLLKPTISSTPTKHSLKNSVSEGTAESNTIVRSNSFTLDTPSKALLDHLKQQQNAAANSSAQQNLQQSLLTKRNSPLNNCGSRVIPSASATRDTVESKAKRVQKVELKPRAAQMRFPTRSNSATGGYTLGNKSSNTLINKTANKPRSPYEFKSSAPKNKLGRSNTNKTQTNSPSTILVKSAKSTTSATTATPTTPKTSHNCYFNSNNHVNNNNNNINNNNNNTSCNNSSKSNSHGSINTVRSVAKTVQSGILSEIEAEHRQKLAELIAQQQEEQTRLQLAFQAQQKLLIEQLSSSIDKVQLTAASPRRSSNESSPTKSTSYAPNSDRSGSILNTTKSPTLSLISSSALSHSVCDLTMLEDTSCAASSINTYVSNNNGRTPRRRLFDQAPGGSINAGQNSMISNLSANRRLHHYQLENERRIAAATVICAYARGFLTRRLFQTEQIQRIVQTIRDTLIFVLNLHMETMENPAEANTTANIKLKARLLQQLSSASRTLYLVFFQTTVAERMEIIARDRKRIKTKLLSLNLKRSPRIVA